MTRNLAVTAYMRDLADKDFDYNLILYKDRWRVGRGVRTAGFILIDGAALAVTAAPPDWADRMYAWWDCKFIDVITTDLAAAVEALHDHLTTMDPIGL